MALLRHRSAPLLLARCVVALGCTGLAPLTARAQAPRELEQQVKAAYLLNFTRYVDWPTAAFGHPDAPVNLCVLSSDEFGAVVERTVAGRRSRGRLVRVLRPDTPAQARDCHVAFVGGHARGGRAWMEALNRSPTLTVGEGVDFLRRGGMVAFVVVGETVRFEIDDAAARRAGLQISSRVLALATRVRPAAGDRR